jgi:hypothetical protein
MNADEKTTSDEQMAPDEQMPYTFRLREMQCQDDEGRQFVLRVDDAGNVVCTALFDRRGEEVKLENVKLGLSIAIRKREKDVLLTRLCMCGPYLVNGKWIYVPC